MKLSSQAKPVELWWRRLKNLWIVCHDDIWGTAFAHLSVRLVRINTRKVTSLSWGIAERGLFWIHGGLKNFPESQSFISGSTCNSSTVWAHSKMKNSTRVASKICYLLHLRILPNAKLVIDKAMRREDFSVVRVPLQCANLRFSLNWLYQIATVCVPKLDSLISWTTPWGKEMPLPWAPSESFNCCLMISETIPRLSDNRVLVQWSHPIYPTTHPCVNVPDTEDIIIAATS